MMQHDAALLSFALQQQPPPKVGTKKATATRMQSKSKVMLVAAYISPLRLSELTTIANQKAHPAEESKDCADDDDNHHRNGRVAFVVLNNDHGELCVSNKRCVVV
jgi:hypothetical protein